MTVPRISGLGAGLFTLTALMVASLHAVQLDSRSLFEEANQLYRIADYEGALERYRAILQGGRENGQLYYNMGNCYFKLGDLGRSILHYERALRLMPREADTRANLELARSLIADDITPLPGFWVLRFIRWWTHLLSRAVLIPVVAATYIGLMLAVVTAVLSRHPTVQRIASRAAFTAGVVCAVFAVNLAVLELEIGSAPYAVILADEVSVQSAPSEDRSLQLFSIHEGTKVRVDQRSGDWAEVVLADGKVGWVKAEVFEVI